MIKGCYVGFAALFLAAAPALADPAPLKAYAALPLIQDPRLSPDGMSVAMVSPVNDLPALVTRKVNGSETLVLPTGPDTQPVWFHWKSDTRLLASIRTSGWFVNRDEVDFTRLVFIDADGGNPKWAQLNKDLPVGARVYGRVTNRAPQFQDRLISLEPENPEKVLLAVTPENDWAHPEVVSVDIHSGAAHTVLREANVVSWVADAAGEVRAATAIKRESLGGSETHRKVIARLHKGDDWTTIDEGDVNEGHRFTPVGFSKDRPAILYVLTDGASGHLEAREYDLEKHALGDVLAASPDCDAVSFGHDNQVIGFRAPCVAESDRYIDPAWQHDWLSVKHALKAPVVMIGDRSADGKRDLIEVEPAPSAPHTFWVLDRHGDKPELHPWSEAYPGLEAESIAETRHVTYTARDGRTIPAFITVPRGTQGAVPFVVLVHDGPTRHDSRDFNWTVQFLVSRGYGVFQPQFRGSSGYGTDFEQAGYQQWGGLMQDDVADGTRWLIQGKHADAGRVCIAGIGYGGYGALMGAIKEPSLYSCVVTYGAIADLERFVQRMHHFTFRDVNRPRVKNDDQDADDLSPVEHADQIKVPVLMIHGRKDVRILVEHTEEMERALKRAGKSVETVYLEEGDSRMSHSADRQAWLGGLEKLLGATLKPAAVTTAGSGSP